MDIKNLNLNDIARRLAGNYLMLTGKQIICSFPASDREYSDIEMAILGEDVDKIILKFSQDGFLEKVGFRREWYRILTVPPTNDIDQVLSTESLEELGLVEVLGGTPDDKWVGVYKI